MKTLKFEVVIQGELASQLLLSSMAMPGDSVAIMTRKAQEVLTCNLEGAIGEVLAEGVMLNNLQAELLTVSHSINVTVADSLEIAPKPPAAVRQALEHVRRFHPEIDRVTFKPNGEWEYSADGDAPEGWSDEIDMRVIQAAADSTNGPAVFFVLEG